MKSPFNQKEIRNTIISAIVGAMVAIILVPISQTISFMLNEYLSRPILSIEYLEFRPEENIRLGGLNDIYQSHGFTNYCVNKNIKAAIDLMRLQPNKSTFSSEEITELQAALAQFVNEVSIRILFLKRLQNNITTNTSENSLKKAYSKYLGRSAQYSVGVVNPEKIQSTLSISIQDENESLTEVKNIATKYQESLKRKNTRDVGTLKIQVSVLNRGDTDGLIRNTALLILTENNISLPLKKIIMPSKGEDQSIAVTVMNPSEGSLSANSVGKVERKSMTDIWYEVDKSNIPVKALNTFWTGLMDSRGIKYTVVLYDQKNDKVISNVVRANKRELILN